ncbi:hypothetical protein [Pedobacter sandarakinus]|uniref:hypothetical protein n=1 Tax=Pedobacter sandarakinus TaxID=353156 RepID=UPI0022454301|nr:hypothetical protein [Pedobacter sandarakinus]MCX2573319.1 hypothetical protein [Pedobacter sandarakinus]
MKSKLLILSVALGLGLASCSGNKADSENADSMNNYTDTNAVVDTNVTDTSQTLMADSTTNAPADTRN